MAFPSAWLDCRSNSAHHGTLFVTNESARRALSNLSQSLKHADACLLQYEEPRKENCCN